MTIVAAPVLVRAKVAEILRHNESARVVALAAAAVWPYDERLDMPGGRVAIVRPCVSTLAIRDELRRAADLAAQDVLVLLTEYETSELGASITARLAAQKVLPLDRWQQLTSLFRAHTIDPALVDEQWAVDALLAIPPADGYPAVANGYLDRATALTTLAETQAGLTPLDLDLAGLLQWSLDSEHLARWRDLDPAVREGLGGWLSGRGGRRDIVAAVLRCFAGSYGPDTVAVGLVLAALSHPESPQDAQIPRTMLETRAVGGALDPTVAAEWGRAAEGLVRRLLGQDSRALAGKVLQRAEGILVDLGGAERTHPSAVLESGLTMRVRNVGARVDAVLRRRSSRGEELASAEREVARLNAHALAADHAERVRHAEMAVRLLRWLVRQDSAPQPVAASLAAAACRQQTEDAWVDVARARVWEGDVEKVVAAAYRRLCAAVDALRGDHERRFAALLADHTRTGSSLGEILPVEDVLDEIVLPLASRRRVLLAVLDGMSTAVARELLADLSARGWIEHTRTPPRPVLAALPSITRASRTSLLCGRLTDGTQSHEKAAFDERGWPLFHKRDLTAAGAGDALTPEMLDAVNGDAAVVGVVVNTVDDTLDKGGRAPWTAASVDRLLDLLTAAHEADRVVLLVSDHGHVHERGSRLVSDDSGGARWRSSERPPGDDEVELAGPRVLLGGGRVVAAWNERLRYTDRRNGYHGGASAQEVIIPLALVSRVELDLPGWVPMHHAAPDWWVEPTSVTVGGPTPMSDRPGRPAKTAKTAKTSSRPRRGGPVAAGTNGIASAEEPVMAGLFDAADVVSGAAPEMPEMAAQGAQGRLHSWVERVLAGDVLASRLARLRRGAMPADRLAVLLRALDARGCTATRAAVARALDVPEARLASHIAAAQRVLNIDGYEVLRIDGDTVRLNKKLLQTQTGVS